MFQGSSALSLDAKGRLTVPAKHRDALVRQCEGQLTLTRHPDGCLMLFPRPVWEVHREKIAVWPLSARAWQRLLLGSASDVDMDGTGRILVPPELRTAVGLSKDVMMLGMGSNFEIWDAQALAAKEEAALAEGVPEALADFNF